MITSKDCYLKNNCYKYEQNNCCDEFCQKLFRIDNLYHNALLTDKQIKYQMRLPGSNNPDYQVINKIIKLGNDRNQLVGEISKGNNYYIHSSNCGNGKTFWAIWLLKKYLSYKWAEINSDECHALFISVPKFLIELKKNISEHSEYANKILDSVLTADLVIWDEIGSKAGTEYEKENLLMLINDRINSGKSNIYTSNIDGDKLKLILDERLYSRIISCSKDIEFKGKDLRTVFVKNNGETGGKN